MVLTRTDIKKPMGLKRSDLLDLKPKIQTQKYIDDTFFDVSNAYVLDVESYKQNSRIRLIQLYDVTNNTIILFLHGKTNFKHEKIYQDKTIKQENIKVSIREFKDEKDMIEDFFKLIQEKPKHIIGHNVAHFDLGLLCARKSRYKIKGVHFFSYGVGSGVNGRRVSFSYVVKEENDDGKWFTNYEKTRYLVMDTMLICFSLGISASLKNLSELCKSKFPKIDLGMDGYKEFEKKRLDYKPVLYAVYDVLSIPEVHKYLRNIYEEPSRKFLRIPAKQSHRCVEHVWMKGSGAIADASLSKLLGVGINVNTPDYLSKYFGGVTRCFNQDLVLSNRLEPIRYLDFTSFYPFSIRKQKIFDILNGKFEKITNEKFHKHKKKYDDMIYSSSFKVKAKRKTRVIIEGEKHKEKDKIGIGWFRSFNKEERVQQLQHEFITAILNRGETTIITKTEYEITKSMIGDNDLIIVEIIDALIPTSSEKSEEYIKLYELRTKFKKEGNPAEKGIKTILNSMYGKIAESKGKWFNLACASAITGYCRATLTKTITYAEKTRCKILYSDTDSLYIKGNNSNIKKVQEYAEKFNKHPSRFGSPNLKDEGEDIKAFWGIKRKTYCKLINEDGKNILTSKGENGNSDIKWRDTLFRLWVLTNCETRIKHINKNLQNTNLKLGIGKMGDELDKFEEFSKHIYEKYKGKILSDIFDVNSKAKITRLFNIHLKKSTTYVNGFYHKKIIDAWKNETDEPAYCGLFFSINRDYTFKDKPTNELKWALNYQNYYKTEERTPVINAKEYEKLLLMEIRVDTIKIKTRSTISLHQFDEETRKRLTNNLMAFGHVGITKKVHDIHNYALTNRLRIPQNLSVENTIFLNKATTKELMKGADEKKIYSNATLFVSSIGQIDASCRINKLRMFVDDRNIFNIYRFLSQLGSYLQRLMISRFKENKITQKKKLVKGVELDYFPRFTFVSQCDIHQGTTEEHLRNMHGIAYDSEFHTSTINKFIAYQLLDYLHLIAYHKRSSAENKIRTMHMQEWEQRVFELEKDEEYRSEIKFKLKRNFYETLSYMFCLNSIKQEKFFDLVKTPMSRFGKKVCDFYFNSWVKGHFEFNDKKCVILFDCYSSQVKNQRCDKNVDFEYPHLEGSWGFNAKLPPQFNENEEILEKYRVRWRFETRKIVDANKLEDINIEVIRDF